MTSASTKMTGKEKEMSRDLDISWSQSLARSGVHNLLSNIQIGALTLREEDNVYRFGQSAVNTDLHAIVDIKDKRVYQRVMFGGTIGAGETYMQGLWSSPDLLSVIRLMVINMDIIESMDKDRSWFRRRSSAFLSWLGRNSRQGSKKNIAAHYDLSNDFFKLMLDENMMYSAAYFPSEDTNLEQAALEKLDLVCRKLQLQTSDHLLEIGTGWGGLAIYAAKKYGCRVTTTTLSQQQYDYAKAWIEREGLEGSIELLLCDYRDLTGKYDKIVSIEMIEAVGHQYYKQYFNKCSDLLTPDGLMLIQAITIADQRYESAKSDIDFIQKYIFPGGSLPSKAVIADNIAKHTDMQLVNLQDMTAHYARTLKEWRQRFLERLNEVKALGFDSVFCRMWEYYLCYCEGGFRERVIGTEQFLMAKPRANPNPIAR